MPNTPLEITALPVVVPLGAVVFAILLWRLHRLGAVTLPRIAAVAVLCVYGAGVIGNTLLPIFIGATPSDLPWWSALNLVPLVHTDTFDMLDNVLVFLPLGFILPIVFRVSSVRGVLLAGFLVSLTMEAIQFVNAMIADGGHIADINDLLANTLGAPIGYGLYRIALLLPSVARLARAATWPVRRDNARQASGAAR